MKKNKEICKTCNGAGKVIYTCDFDDNQSYEEEDICPNCNIKNYEK